MKAPTLVNIKRTEADKKAEAAKYDTIDGKAEDYPWGLSLRLDNETIAKLGLGDTDADDKVTIHAQAFVSEDTVNKRNGKTERSVSLQITDISVMQSESGNAAAEEMYGKGK